jgi:hypothetical protein
MMIKKSQQSFIAEKDTEDMEDSACDVTLWPGPSYDQNQGLQGIGI